MGGQQELPHFRDKIESCPHGGFGIVLMGLGIAEIGENAVAHIPRNMAPTLLDDGGAGALESADDGAEILGIELNRKRSRAHKIAKQ